MQNKRKNFFEFLHAFGVEIKSEEDLRKLQEKLVTQASQKLGEEINKKQFNRKTRKAIEEADKDKNLIESKDKKDFFKETGIDEENNMHCPSVIAIELLRQFNHVPILDLEEFLGFLEDYNLLNDQGLKFKKHIWECFIKEEK